jgi:Domain of unknown function (DUF4142)
MVRDHEAVNKQALALLDKLKVRPEDNDTSKSLANAASKKHEELYQVDGTAFNKAYAENEVTHHRNVNGALEKTLIPSAQNAELKSLLQTGLKLFKEHEKHAEKLVSELQHSYDGSSEYPGGSSAGVLSSCVRFSLARSRASGSRDRNRQPGVCTRARGAACERQRRVGECRHLPAYGDRRGRELRRRSPGWRQGPDDFETGRRRGLFLPFPSGHARTAGGGPLTASEDDENAHTSVERHFLGTAVVNLRRTRRGMVRHLRAEDGQL